VLQTAAAGLGSSFRILALRTAMTTYAALDSTLDSLLSLHHAID